MVFRIVGILFEIKDRCFYGIKKKIEGEGGRGIEIEIFCISVIKV